MDPSTLPPATETQPSRLESYTNNVIEGGWLCALIATPIFFNIFSTRVFEPDKVFLLRSIAVFMLAAWGIKIIEGFLRGRVKTKLSQKHSETFRMARPVLLLGLIWFSIQLISNLLSIDPRQSFQGSYARLQGLFTQGCYFVIFISIGVLLKTPEQRQRLISITLLSSLPVGLFGILQHLNQDPLPWEHMVVDRVISSMGNPIFLAAYLILVIPLALHRVWTSLWDASRGERSDIKWVLGIVAVLNLGLTVLAWHRGFLTGALSMLVTLLLWVGQAVLLDKPKVPFFRVGVYLVLLSTQVSCVYFTKSRGPWLGLFAGLLLMGLLWNVVRRKWTFVWSTGAMAGVAVGFILLLNVTSVPLGGLRKHPSLARISNIVNATAQVRIEIWGGVEKLLADRPDRVLLGYGPESMQLAYFPFYPAGLAKLEGRNQSPDRSHNGTFDALIETGLLGLLAQLALISGLFLVGFRKLSLIRTRRETTLFLLLMYGCGATAVLSTRFLDPLASWRFAGVALPPGMTIGMGIYLIGFSALSSFGSIPKPPRMGRDTNKLLVVVLLASLLAHWIEVDVGIAITASQLLFWVCAGLLIGIPTEKVQAISHATSDAKLRLQITDVSKRKQPVSSTEEKKRLHVFSLMAFTILCILATDFLMPGLIDAQKPFLGWLFGMTWIFLGLAFICEKYGVENPSSRTRSTGIKYLHIYVGYTILPVLLFVALQGSSLGLPQAESTFWFPPYLALLLFAMLLAGALLPFPLPVQDDRTTKSPRRRLWRTIAYAGGVGLAIVIIYHGNARFLQADIWHRQGTLRYKVQGLPEQATSDFHRAIALTPHQDFYLPSLGEVQLMKMDEAIDDAAIETEFIKALASFREATKLNPLSPDHQINAGRVYKHYADRFSGKDPKKVQAALKKAIPYYEAGLKRQPVRVHWWNELAWIYALLGQLDKAHGVLDQSLGIEHSFPPTWLVRGDIYRVQGQWKKAEVAFRKSTTLNEKSYKAHFLLGLALFRLNRKIEASASFRLADEWATQSPKGRGHLAALYANAGNLKHALMLARDALQTAQPDEKFMLKRMIARIERTLEK